MTKVVLKNTRTGLYNVGGGHESADLQDAMIFDTKAPRFQRHLKAVMPPKVIPVKIVIVGEE